MAAEIVLADERSRQHFANDLHDTVVQTMGGRETAIPAYRVSYTQKDKANFYRNAGNAFAVYCAGKDDHVGNEPAYTL